MRELLADPAFRVYAVCAGVLVLKMLITGSSVGLLRVLRKNYATAEDYALMGLPPKPADEQIERLRRAHQNDLENVLPFLAIAFVYVLTGPSVTVAGWLLVLFTIARVAHTIVYAFGLQPWRTIVFEIANLSLAAIAVLTIVNALA